MMPKPPSPCAPGLTDWEDDEIFGFRLGGFTTRVPRQYEKERDAQRTFPRQ
uniref:Uncharacterized protein n=1 Tax=Anguilla anguilla TaxID=7936 RepID=A0A0E9RSP4_ANGAN